MENLAILTAFYLLHLLGFGKKIKTLFTSQGRSVLGKTVPEVLDTARGPRDYPRPRAQFFPIRTSRPVNNIYLAY